MSSIGSVSSSNAVSVLIGSGGPLQNSGLSKSLLESASSSDLADISTQALALSQVDSLYGGSTGSSSSTSSDWGQSLVDAAYGMTPSTSSTSSSSDAAMQLLSSVYSTGSSSSSSSSSTSTSKTSGSTVNVTG